MEKAGIACPISGPVATAAWARSAVAAKARIRFGCIRLRYCIVRQSARLPNSSNARAYNLYPAAGLRYSRGPRKLPGRKVRSKTSYFTHSASRQKRNNSSSARDEVFENGITGASAASAGFAPAVADEPEMTKRSGHRLNQMYWTPSRWTAPATF